jgi:hypothetical protein
MDPTGSGALYRNNVLNQKFFKNRGLKYFDEEFRLRFRVPKQIMIRYRRNDGHHRGPK